MRTDHGKTWSSGGCSAAERDARTREEMAADMNASAKKIVMNACFVSAIQLSEEPEPQGSGTAVFKKLATAAFSVLFAQDGRRFYPAFTDWEESDRWESMKGAQHRTLILSFDDYGAMAVGSQGGDGVVN